MSNPLEVAASRRQPSLHPAADAPILKVVLDAFPAPVDPTHELGRTDPLL